MIMLFTDFDGVLHKEGVFLSPCDPTSITESERRFLTTDNRLVTGSNLFEHADRLAAALKPFPDVKIVITSTWRIYFGLDALKGFLPSALADRVIGVTPQMFSRDGVLQRAREIGRFYREKNIYEGPWLALDDHDYYFGSADHPNLILCDGKEGFTDDVAAVLRKRLSDLQGRAA